MNKKDLGSPSHRTYLQELLGALSSLELEKVAEVARLLQKAVAGSRTVFTCGNGGSFANASHFAVDLQKGSRDRFNLRCRAISLGANSSMLSAIGNDASFDAVFSRELQEIGAPGDVLVAFSCSGTSPNVSAAIKEAARLEMKTVLFTSILCPPEVKAETSLTIAVESTHFGIIEDIHASLSHMLAYHLEGES